MSRHLELLDSPNPDIFTLCTHGPGPSGRLPLTPEQLRGMASGDLFGWTQNAGMGWDPKRLVGKQFLILSTQGGLRAPDGSPIALGYHTGHWEIALLVEEAAKTFSDAGAIPFAAYCSDPCDGRTNGTVGMLDSLPYRNDAATVFRRQIRSLPTRRGVMGVATCDKGLPAMMMALAGTPNLPTILVPGGVTLLAEEGEDAGKVQTIAARFARESSESSRQVESRASTAAISSSAAEAARAPRASSAWTTLTEHSVPISQRARRSSPARLGGAVRRASARRPAVEMRECLDMRRRRY